MEEENQHTIPPFDAANQGCNGASIEDLSLVGAMLNSVDLCYAPDDSAPNPLLSVDSESINSGPPAANPANNSDMGEFFGRNGVSDVPKNVKISFQDTCMEEDAQLVTGVFRPPASDGSRKGGKAAVGVVVQFSEGICKNGGYSR